MHRSKEFWTAAWKRAVRTVAQTLSASIPAGFIVTPAMVQSANWSIVWVVLAWLATGVLAGIASILTSIATGLPEIDSKKTLIERNYIDANGSVTRTEREELKNADN